MYSYYRLKEEIEDEDYLKWCD